MQFVSNLIRFGDKHQLITAEVFGPLLFSFINIMTTWTKKQLVEEDTNAEPSSKNKEQQTLKVDF